MTEPTDRQDEIDTKAAEWAARLRGRPLDAAEQRALENWLDNPRHVAAFAEAETAWSRMDEVAANPGALRQDIPPAHTIEPPVWQTHLPSARRPVRRLRAATMAACLLLVVAAAGLWFGDPRIMIAADHRTEPGERRVVELSDGSTVELGPASAIALRYSDAERRVELLSGLAYFTAAPRQGGEHRPFVVEAATGTARALGTQFMVDRFADSVEVTVVEHEVAVAVTMPNGQAAQVVLSPGQSARYAETGLAPMRAAKVEQVLAWRRGRLSFDRVPLDHVVTELNRYRRGRIVIGNSTLASRQVSGVFDTADPDAALATIARELGVRITSAPLVTFLY